MARAKKTRKTTKKEEVVEQAVEEQAVEEQPVAEEIPAEESTEAAAPEAPEEEAPEEAVKEAIAESMGETRKVSAILKGGKGKTAEDILNALANHKEAHIANLARTLKDYMASMSQWPAVAPGIARRAKTILYNSMRNVIEQDDYAKFTDGFSILSWWFKEYSTSHASPDRINNAIGGWEGGARSKYSAATLNATFVLIAEKGVKDIGQYVNINMLFNPKHSDLTEKGANNMRRLMGVE